MKPLILILLNLALVFVFLRVMKKTNLLSVLHNGRWALTWLAIGVIALMDELTSIYYAPFEAYRFIGFKAIIYIIITSVFIRILSTRMVEMSEILEVNKIRGGGGYSFNYLVMGPMASFVSAASILVVYLVTASVSTVSSVENGTTFIEMSEYTKYMLKFTVVWVIAFVNIMGIRENAKLTFFVFIGAAFVLVNLVAGGLLALDGDKLSVVAQGAGEIVKDYSGQPFYKMYGNLIIGIGSCILAYSGIQSVVLTASMCRDWKDIRKAYMFLALTVGIFTPLIALLALSSTPNVGSHQTDLIPAFATAVMGKGFGVLVSALASITLVMAVNTAMVASSELIEKIAERYNFGWLIKVNKKHSLYRIHFINAILYSAMIFITNGSQETLAKIYAVALIAVFSLDMISLFIYKYRKGTVGRTYNTSRIGTLLLLVLLISIFIYISISRPEGFILWLGVTVLFFIAGVQISKHRAPEIKLRRASKSPMDVVFAIAGSESEDVHLYLTRPRESVIQSAGPGAIFVSFYAPRTDIPALADNPDHIWISMPERTSLDDMISGLLETIQYDIPQDKKVHVHFGWPLSSWVDRLSTGIMVYRLLKLPRMFPNYVFHIDYIK